MARYEFPGRRLFRAFVTVPFVLPTVVVATAFLVLFRPGGALAFLGWQRGVGPLLVAEVFFNVAVIVRTVGGFWSSLDPRRTDAARVLGASRFRAFREVTLPLLGPPIAAAASIVFLFTFTAFGVVLLLADPAHATIEVEIYRQAVQLLDFPIAAALAFLQMVAVIALLLVLARMQERRAVDATARRGARHRAPAPRVRAGRGRRRDRRDRRCSSAVRCSCSRSSRCASAGAGRSRRTGRSARARATDTLFVPAWQALRYSLEFAAIAAVIAIGDRRAGVGGDRVAARAARPARWTRC